MQHYVKHVTNRMESLMVKTTRIQPADLLGYSRLVIAATLGITAVVEAMHANILRSSGMWVPEILSRQFRKF